LKSILVDVISWSYRHGDVLEDVCFYGCDISERIARHQKLKQLVDKGDNRIDSNTSRNEKD